MTAAGLGRPGTVPSVPPAPSVPSVPSVPVPSVPLTTLTTRRERTVAGWRLAGLYLASRRAPVAVALLVALGALLWIALYGHWNIAGGPAAREFFPLTIETGAAAVVAVSFHGPFGESERSAGRWLPWLRLGTAAAMIGVAFGLLAAGAAGGGLPGGSLALLRNFGGVAGIGLVSASVLGGSFGWTGPMAYLVITEGALAHRSTTPWIWAAHAPHDLGAAICAALAFAVGAALITTRGDRDRAAR
jgi:hypothetical protein